MYIRSQWIHNLLDFGLQVGWLVFQVFFLWFQFTRWPTAFHWRSRHHWYASSSNIESQLQQSQNQGFARTCRTTLLNATAVARLCIFGTSALAAEPTSPSVYHFQRHITEGAHFECFGELNCEDYAAGRVRWGLGDLDRWHRTLMEYYILVQPIVWTSTCGIIDVVAGGSLLRGHSIEYCRPMAPEWRFILELFSLSFDWRRELRINTLARAG